MQNLWTRIAIVLATGFGVGYVPWAPGTFGSLLGLAFVWGLHQLPEIGAWGLSLFAVTVGVPICDRAARAFGQCDPGIVVFDEIAAFPVVFAGSLAGWIPFNGLTAAAGFALFRLFDITKPWPTRRLELLHGGLGIMADDLAAGVYAGVALMVFGSFV